VVQRTLACSVDGLLTTTTRRGTDDTLIHETSQGIPDITDPVVGLETTIEMTRDHLCGSALGTESEKSIERKLAAILDASGLVDRNATTLSLAD